MSVPIANQTADTRTQRAPYQWIALVVGAVFLVIGVVGFFVTGFDGFTDHDHDQNLLGFAINPLHNIVHIVVGLLGVLLWRTPLGARTFGWILFVAYGATFVYGLIVQDDPDRDFLNLNTADNVLHIVSAVVGLVIALWPSRRERPGEYSTAERMVGGPSV